MPYAVRLVDSLSLLMCSYQADLDQDPIIKGRPVVLQSKDCHALWLSSKALEASLPFPNEVDGGIIVRNDRGNPTGKVMLRNSLC